MAGSIHLPSDIQPRTDGYGARIWQYRLNSMSALVAALCLRGAGGLRAADAAGFDV